MLQTKWGENEGTDNVDGEHVKGGVLIRALWHVWDWKEW